jgi:iron complex outermembrane recepter protein
VGVRAGRVSLDANDRYLANGNDSGALAFRYVNPVLGLRWKPDADTTVHASLGRGYESPTLGELAYRPDGQAGFNTNLQAQTSRQAELGVKLRATSTVSVDATTFLIDTSNEIGVQTNAGGRSSFQNVGRTRRYGAELGAAWRPSNAWRAQVAVSWLAAHYHDTFLTCTAVPCTAPNVAVPAGNRIAGTQAASAWAELAWRPRTTSEGGIEWRALGTTAVNDTNSEFAPGWATVNLRWLERFPIDEHGRIELLGRLDNVLDRRYGGSVIVNDANGRYYEPAAPRNALVSLRYVRQW